MTQYIALLHKNGRKGYGVSFPDFPGGQKIPMPRTVEAIREAAQDWVDTKDAIIATVPLLPAQGKALRVQVTRAGNTCR